MTPSPTGRRAECDVGAAPAGQGGGPAGRRWQEGAGGAAHDQQAQGGGRAGRAQGTQTQGDLT